MGTGEDEIIQLRKSQDTVFFKIFLKRQCHEILDFWFFILHLLLEVLHSVADLPWFDDGLPGEAYNGE